MFIMGLAGIVQHRFTIYTCVVLLALVACRQTEASPIRKDASTTRMSYITLSPDRIITITRPSSTTTEPSSDRNPLAPETLYLIIGNYRDYLSAVQCHNMRYN
eukprot:m.125527 g.125527  ORF g.125527 m.125527 type:complete len:103 (+) comp15620_c1_seq8:122-430(+)